MPLINFKLVKAKNLKMEFEKNYPNTAYLFTDILIISWHSEI